MIYNYLIWGICIAVYSILTYLKVELGIQTVSRIPTLLIVFGILKLAQGFVDKKPITLKESDRFTFPVTLVTLGVLFASFQYSEYFNTSASLVLFIGAICLLFAGALGYRVLAGLGWPIVIFGGALSVVNPITTNSWTLGMNDEPSESSTIEETPQREFAFAFPSEVSKANLSLTATKGSITVIGSAKKHLFEAEVKDESAFFTATLIENKADSLATIRFKNQGQASFLRSQPTQVLLHTDPVWNFDIVLGAGKSDFQLANLKVADISLKCGAAEVDIQIGDLHKETNIDILGGATSITIRTPQNAGISYETMESSLFNSSKFEGGWVKEDGIMYTDGFDNAPTKIRVKAISPISNIHFKRSE